MGLINKIRYQAYRYSYTQAVKLNHKKPIDVSLELSSMCNMNCTYCYHSDQANLPFTKGIMDKNFAFKVIMQAADAGVNSIKFNHRGEPTMSPHYFEITELAKDLAGGSVFIDRLTNSNFKIFPSRRDVVFKGLAHMTKVKVSYDSFDKSVFEKQRAGGNHDLTTENIELFYNHPDRIKSETVLVIQAVRTLLNKDEDIIGEVKRRWPEAQVSIRDMVAGRVEKDLSSMENRVRDNSDRQSCIQAHARMIVHWDGRVAPCCPSIKNDLIIGDLNKNFLVDVFNSMEAKSLRASLINKTAFDKEPCKGCSSFESFKGYKAPWNS